MSEEAQIAMRETPISAADTKRLREMIRVDHAGEYGAVQIYRGQRAVFEKIHGKERLVTLLREMEDGEQDHLRSFDEKLNQYRMGPTILAPLWNIAGFALGAGTALMGEKAAMACTSAVEEVIERHYADQAEELEGVDDAFCEMVLKFRADELHHKDTALAEGAEETPGYGALKTLIQAGCRVAIRLSEKI